MRRKIALFGMLWYLIGAAHGAPSLCTKNETVYFSCKANTGKAISLCGKVFSVDKSGQRVEHDNPWLQYKYGRPEAIELIFPATKKESIDHFKPERIRALGGSVRLDAISFVSGGIGYSVQAVSPDSAKPWQGLSIGDPRDFGLDRGPKPRERYPDAEIRCAKEVDTAAFFRLVDYLDGQ